MGCVSSSFLNQDDDFTHQYHIGTNSLTHHFVSLTSTTYGLLSLDPPQSPTPPTLVSPPFLQNPLSESKPIRYEPEIINSWELMAGLDLNDSFRFSPLPPMSKSPPTPKLNKQQQQPSVNSHLIGVLGDQDVRNITPKLHIPRNKIIIPQTENNNPNVKRALLYPNLCPPNGENKVVLYTTSLRGVRSTFEGCKAVRMAIQSLGYTLCERDISMDKGFREELKCLLSELKVKGECLVPRLFVKGRYIGGAEEVLRLYEEGGLAELLKGMPKGKSGGAAACDGCGGFAFLPCFNCHGSCKVVVFSTDDDDDGDVIRCPDCNENGLVLCPICS